jgi:hypothetical protein
MNNYYNELKNNKHAFLRTNKQKNTRRKSERRKERYHSTKEKES